MAPPLPTLADAIGEAIADLSDLVPIAADEHRSHRTHEALVDQVDALGRRLCHAARGRGRRC